MQDIDHKQIAQDIEDGTYFVTARRWYSQLFHTPITERSYYLVIIFLAFVNGYFAFESFVGIFPLRPGVPFITTSRDVWEEQPHILRIAVDRMEDKNVAVMKFLVKSYVINREGYDLNLYELNYRNIWSQSSADVFNIYKDKMDASNAYSPYRQYTNKAKRIINVLSVSTPKPGYAEVVYEATVHSTADNEDIGDPTKWKATLSYKYTSFDVDQSVVEKNAVVHLMSRLGVFGLTKNTTRASDDKRKVIPMTFLVSDYISRELLE